MGGENTPLPLIYTQMKQTAISQIFAQIKAARNDNKFWNDSMLIDWLIESEERFKQIEKEQMDKVSEDWWVEGCSYMKDNKRIYESFEQYYNETYNNTQS